MNKKRIIIIIVLLFTIIVFGFTFAYFNNSFSFINNFKTSKFKTTIYETFISPQDWTPGTTTSKKVYVTNDGSTDEAVRISYTEEWKDSDNNILSNTQNNESLVIINLANNNDWVKVGDYYYYKYRLPEGETTSTFIDSVTFSAEVDFNSNCETSGNLSSCKYSFGDYEDATYTLNFKIDIAQYDSYKDIWNINYDLLDIKPISGLESFNKYLVSDISRQTVGLFSFEYRLNLDPSVLSI